MIYRSSFSGSAARPVTPVRQGEQAFQPQRKQSTGSMSAADSLHFGFWSPVGPVMVLDPEADYFAGFMPNASMQEVFNYQDSPAAAVIDRPEALNRIWPVLDLDGMDKPQVDWGKEVLILVAQERSDRKDAIPKAIYFNRFGNYLEIRLKAEKQQGRNPGTAWYLGKVSNCAPPHKSPGTDANVLNARSRVYVRTYD